MIPRLLKISGFLSYRNEVAVDFTSVRVACISGQNGAGKSALLDAMTWALFGEARKNDESVINDAADTRRAAVEFEFEYENTVYRIIRTRERGKASAVEFQLWDGAADSWRVLTERSVRQTDKRICQTLRLDYRTFVNVSFFLQGKADQFTRQNATERKNVLSSILNLDVWETYLQRVSEERKEQSNRLVLVDGQLAEIDRELADESGSKTRLLELSGQLAEAENQRKERQAALENARQMKVLFLSREKEVQEYRSRLEQLERQIAAEREKQAQRRLETEQYQALLTEKAVLSDKMTRLTSLREELSIWSEKAARSFALERERDALNSRIEIEKNRLLQEQQALQKESDQIVHVQEDLRILQAKETLLRQEIVALTLEAQPEEQTRGKLAALSGEESEKKAEKLHLKTQMQSIRERMDNLARAIGTPCPFCGRELDAAHSEQYLSELKAEGTALGERFRGLSVALAGIEAEKENGNRELERILRASHAILQKEKELAPLVVRIGAGVEALHHWTTDAAQRLEQLNRILSAEDFCREEWAAIFALEEKLAALGYDAAAHEQCRRDVAELRPVEPLATEMRLAEAKLEPLLRELQELSDRISAQSEQLTGLRTELAERNQALEAQSRQLPDMAQAEAQFETAQRTENDLRADKGAAEQRLAQLQDKKAVRVRLDTEKSALLQTISRLKTLEKAFGKNGIPALLIDAALPEIQDNANEILGKLTDDRMSLELRTLRDYKDKTREEKMETLDILISDGFGFRDYEMFSGGEAFRVNFAIRLALSRMLAKRAGARLQLLVIDEGFGSQDQDGREKLVETIAAIEDDFEKILVITHLDELKDAFASRIEVEKTAAGSEVKVFA